MASRKQAFRNEPRPDAARIETGPRVLVGDQRDRVPAVSPARELQEQLAANLHSPAADARPPAEANRWASRGRYALLAASAMLLWAVTVAGLHQSIA